MKKFLKIFSLIGFIFLSVFTIAEAFIPSSGSSMQSTLFAFLFDRGPEKATIIEPTSLLLEGNTTIYQGKTETFTITFTPSDTSNKQVTWSIGDTSLLSYSGSNTFLGLEEGVTTITATSVYNPSLSDTLTITIVEEPITELNLSLTTESSLVAGCTSQLEVTTNKDSIDYQSDLTFTSSDESIASIDSTGFIKTHQPGSVTFTVTAIKEGIQETLSLNILEGDFIEVSDLTYTGSDSLYMGDSLEIDLSFNTDASDKTYHLEIEDTSILRYDDNTLIGRAVGSTTVTFISNNDASYKTTATINVLEVKASAITVESTTIQYGKNVRLNYSLVSAIEGKNVSYPAVSFTSSDTSILSVSSSGYLFGLEKGNAKVTITWLGDETITATCYVTVTSLDSATFNNIHYWVRKLLGHFSVFMVTGFFALIVFLYIFFRKKKPLACLSLIYGFALAGLSELCQMAADGRTPTFQDVLIDFSGCVLGTLLMLLVLLIYRLWKKNKEKNKVKALTKNLDKK